MFVPLMRNHVLGSFRRASTFDMPIRMCNTLENARANTISRLLTDNLAPLHLEVVDVSGGCGQMFKIEVCSKQFEGKPLIAQHQIVNKLLEDEIPAMHGLTLRTLTPQQFEKTSNSS